VRVVVQLVSIKNCVGAILLETSCTSDKNFWSLRRFLRALRRKGMKKISADKNKKQNSNGIVQQKMYPYI
jgi:hypothetical protein